MVGVLWWTARFGTAGAPLPGVHGGGAPVCAPSPAASLRLMWRLASLLLVVAALAGCGGAERELTGYAQDPAPVVDKVPLPDLAAGGRPFRFDAPDGGLLLVFFGFTNCPDVCPTALATVASALDGIGDDAARVELAMVTVDPARDEPVLASYVEQYVPDAHAIATRNDDALRVVAEAFGVSYAVSTAESGAIEVTHSGNLFAVDDGGALALTWPTGVTREDLRADLRQLLDAADA